MSIIVLLILLAAIGAITYLIVTKIQMSEGFKTLITIVAIVACIIVALNAFGLMPDLMNVRVGG